MAHRSFSAVKTLRSCGEQYRLERVEKVAQRPQTAAIAGRTVHAATELIDYEIEAGETDRQALAFLALKMAGEVLDKEVEQALSPRFPTTDTFRSFGQSKNNPKGQNIEWFRAFGIPGSIENYLTWRLEKVPHYRLMILPDGDLAMEVPFTISLDGVEIQGQIDRVFIDTSADFAVVLDIKNGPKPDSTEQLGLYREAMMQLNPEAGPYFGSFLYGLKPGSKTGTRQTFPNAMTNWTRENLSTLYTQADKQIAEQIFLANPGKACFMCNVSDVCSFYQASVV